MKGLAMLALCAFVLLALGQSAAAEPRDVYAFERQAGDCDGTELCTAWGCFLSHGEFSGLDCNAAYHGIIYRRRVQLFLEAVGTPLRVPPGKASRIRCQQQS